MTVAESVYRSIVDCEVEIEVIKHELSELPEGTLIMRGSRYHVRTGSSQKAISKDKELLRQLARKAYLTKRLNYLESNLGILRKHFQKLMTEDPRQIISTLPAQYKLLPIDFYYHPSSHQTEDSPTNNAWYSEDRVYKQDPASLFTQSPRGRSLTHWTGLELRFDTNLPLSSAAKPDALTSPSIPGSTEGSCFGSTSVS